MVFNGGGIKMNEILMDLSNFGMRGGMTMYVRASQFSTSSASSDMYLLLAGVGEKAWSYGIKYKIAMINIGSIWDQGGV